MKKLSVLLLLALAMRVSAQSYPVTSINISLPAVPDANVASWGSGGAVFTITAVTQSNGARLNPALEDSKILVLIKKGGTKVCGAYTSSTAPDAGFTTVSKVWHGQNAVSLLGGDCTLPPGDYELSVQFFGYSNGKMVALSDEKIRPFTIQGDNSQMYRAPQAVLPADNLALSSDEALRPITFRWTPVTPKPATPVTYRLTIWQLMQGQTAGQAIKANQPIIIKDIDNLTQAVITNISTTSCDPPYTCGFAWNVQALNREGSPVGNNNGTSTPFSFRKGGNIILYDTQSAIILVNPANNSTIKAGQPVIFTWRPLKVRDNDAITYKLTIVEESNGQSPEQAFRTNKPFFEKDSLSSFRTNKPFFEKDTLPMLVVNYPPDAPRFKPGAKYTWHVEARDKRGQPYGSNGGKSNNSEFTVASPGVYISAFHITCVSYGVYSYSLTAQNPGNNQFNVQQLGLTSSGGTISGTTASPSVPGTIISNGSPVTFTGTFNYGGTYPAVVTANINGYQAGNTQLTSSDTEQDSIKICLCTECDKSSVSFNQVSETPAGSSGNQYNLAGNINVSGLPAVYGIELQIQSYNYTVTPASCSNGVTGIEQSGVFLRPGTTINNSAAIQMFNETVSGGSSGTNNNAAKTIKLISTVPLPSSIPINLLVGLPGPLAGLNSSCCKMSYNLCLTIKVYYDKDGCKSCTFTYCFPSFSN
ncbi:MAG TPA: hypothetical protein VHB48_20565 [Chitinophagaceae bacterium]|nr:hypothetical protein [Chitinophagaceae bacterium]